MSFLRDVARAQAEAQTAALRAALRRVESPRLWHLLVLLGDDVVDLVTFPELGLLRIGELLGRDQPGRTIDEVLAEFGLPREDALGEARRRPEIFELELA